MADGLRNGLSAWKEFRTEAEEYRELDGEHGDRVRHDLLLPLQLRDGKIIHMKTFLDTQDALGGLAE